MKNSSYPIPVYPSQLSYFKSFASGFAKLLAERTSTNPLSAFKRNDYLSMALGYKSHSDLIQSTKFRKEADINEELTAFADLALHSRIADVLWEKLNTPKEDVHYCCNRIAEAEAKSKFIAISRSLKLEYANPLPDETKVSNAFNPLSSPDSLNEASTLISSFIDADVERANKPAIKPLVLPTIQIDVSQMPRHIYKVFSQHPAVQAIDIDVQRRDVRYSFIWHKGHVSKENPNWKISAFFDMGNDAELPMDIVIMWNKFRNWLVKFTPTDRVDLTEMNSGDQIVQLHAQSFSPFARMETELDKQLFNLFQEPKRHRVAAFIESST